jgi:taspase (threonine aspartase 1)
MESPQTHTTIFPRRRCHKGADDNIIDTVGAIAVDRYGNIAAGSSSGGIGMKHSGRTGPAALVGIGTAVIPIDPEDEMKTCVAVVTSGTGEHMATTMASSLCAERIYSSTRKKPGLPGVFESVSEDEAMEAMIATDFMGTMH